MKRIPDRAGRLPLFGSLTLLLLVFVAMLPSPSNCFVVVVPPAQHLQQGSSTQVSGASVTIMKPILSRHVRMSNRNSNDGDTSNDSPLDFLLHPYQSKIPKEIEKEIYEAEGNTTAAKDRGKRIALYSVIAVVGVLAAFFNAFLSELRLSTLDSSGGGGEVPFDLATSPFAWVLDSILWQFLFCNKIGGGLMLLLGAGAGLLAESEFDSRRINAERIWQEMQQRREKAQLKQQQQQKKKGTTQKQKSSLGKKQTKRLAALSEVVVDAETMVAPAVPVESEADVSNAPAPSGTPDRSQASTSNNEGGGLFKGIKDMYEKADTLAASQALLLNKKLEDAGVLGKITDETGLKVIGKEAASKLQHQDPERSNAKDP